MYEGVARNKQQIEATSGAMVGEATRQGNKMVSYLLEYLFLCFIVKTP